ncbi:MAG: hypothetical protein WAW75_01090 [Gallionella sp.]
MSVALVPIPFFQVIQDGIPVSGAKIFTYESGTTTKLNSFTTAAGDVPNANPVICDAQGRAVIYLTDGVLYTLVVAPANDTDPPTAPYGTYNNLYGNSVLPLPYADAGGTADVITATYLVNSPTLVDGYTLLLDIGTTNATTTPTFAPTLNGVLQTARTIQKSVANANVALAVGDLQGVAMLVYDLGNLVWILQNPALWPTANRTDSGEVTVTAHATTGDIFAAAANSILWDDAGGAITTTIFPNASKAGMVRELRCNGASKFAAGANLLIEGIPSGTTITLANGALVKVRAITTTQFKMTYSVSGTFTATGTGFTANPTATAVYKVENGIVNLYIPQSSLTGTSNNTAFTITGLPSCIVPVSGQELPVLRGLDNAGNITVGASIGAGSSTINLYVCAATPTWTASSTKRLIGSSIIYPIA